MADVGEQTPTWLRFPNMKKPASTCIARNTFKRLPFIIQVQYAVFYKVPQALYLTSEEICAALCTKNKWIPVIDTESHVRYPSPKGVVVALSVRDLAEWLAREKAGVTSEVGKSGGHDRSAEVDDDDDPTPQITERLDAIQVLNRVAEPNPVHNKRPILKRPREDSDDEQGEVRPSKRVRWEDLYYSASQLVEEDSVTSSEAEDSPIEAKVAWKDHSYKDKDYDSDSSFTSCDVSEDTDDMKLEDRIGARLAYKYEYQHDHTEPRSSDSSSSDSSLHWSSEGEHPRMDEHDIRNAYDLADNDDVLQWKAYIIDDGDDDDSNDSYFPPSWTLEDVLEVSESRLLKDLDKLHPLEERVSCGPMSPCGLSTDDSEEEHRPEAAFRSTSLYYRLPVTMRRPRSKYGRSMTGRFPIISKADLAYKRRVSHWRRLGNDILAEAYLGEREVWFRCDVDEQIAEAFAPNDRFEYDFHSEAWKHFAPFDFANFNPESEANQEYDSGDEENLI